jgi:hypothetical protein
MSIWDWIRDYLEQAARDGHAERLRLGDFHPRAYALRETDPGAMLTVLDEGRRHAQALEEPWWEVFFEHWCIQCLLWCKLDYRDVLDRAVANVLRIRRPGFEAFPLRLRVHRLLVAAYLNIDPLGYAEQILEAIIHLEAELENWENGEEKYLVLGDRMAFHLELEEWEAAAAMGARLLRWADADAWRYNARLHLVYTYGNFCALAHRKEDWEALANWSRLGEPLAAAEKYQMRGAEFVLWQALLLRRAGDEHGGLRLHRQGLARLAPLGKPPTAAVFDAICAFHACAGEVEQELEARRSELSTLLDRGRLADEARCRIHICHLLRRLGRPRDEELRLAHAAIARLRKPERYLADLQRE